MSILVGSNFRILSTLTDVDTGLALSPMPSDVTYKVQNPVTGTVTSYTLSGGGVALVNTNQFKVTANATHPGTWKWSAVGAGGQGVDKGTFEVDPVSP